MINKYSIHSSRNFLTSGYLGDHPGKGLDLVEVTYPYTRWVSSSCAVTYTNGGRGRGRGGRGLIIGLCPACSGEGDGDGQVKEELHDNDDVESEDYDMPDQDDHVEERRRRFKRTRKKLGERKALRDQGRNSIENVWLGKRLEIPF